MLLAAPLCPIEAQLVSHLAYDFSQVVVWVFCDGLFGVFQFVEVKRSLYLKLDIVDNKFHVNKV